MLQGSWLRRVTFPSCVALAVLMAGCGSTSADLAQERNPDAGKAADGAGTMDVVSPPLDGMTGTDDAGEDGTVCGTASFDLSETQELLTVPSNVSYMHVKAWGAGGNGEGQCPVEDGGIGGYSEAVFQVLPGTNLIVIVGQRGKAGMTGEQLFKFGFGQWGGGGLSGVFSGTDPIDESSNARALVIAGGGGGASAPGCHPAGTGNHPSAGGQTTMQGSSGTDDVNSGGGGYLGGTGGGHLEGGKGGTGFVAPSAIDSKMEYVEPESVKPPNTDDPDYDGIAGGVEKNGRVVIHFSCTGPVIR
jgi:hypothetical protein